MVIAILSTAEQNTVKGPWRKDVQCTKTSFFFRHALLLEETFLRLKTFHVSSKRALARKLFATPLKLDYSDIKEKENF